MQNCDIKGTDLCFFPSYSKDIINIYCTFKTGEIVNHENFVIFSFLKLRYIRETYSKYFQNSISEADLSSVTEKSTTRSCFLRILYTFSLCNMSLY